jgi:hypothetical protein
MALRRSVGLAGGTVLLAAVAVTLYATLSHAGSGMQRSSGTSPRPAANGIDFSRDGAANFAAAQLGQRLLADLPSLPGYAGLRIVSYGIEVDVVGKPATAMKAVVGRDSQQYQGKPIPVGYRSVRYTERELNSVMAMLTADQAELTGQGIQLTEWGIDVPSNTVQIGLYHYTPAYRDVLLARYGSRVSVIPQDVRPSNASLIGR